MVVVIILLVSAIRGSVERHRCNQDVATLSKIGKQMSKWAMDHGETFPNLTNKSFLATLAQNETDFLIANKVVVSSGTNSDVAVQAETANGTFALYVDGSVMAVK